jgi:hypothetical protein
MQNDFLPRKPAPTKLKSTPPQNTTDSEQLVPFQTPDQVSQHDQDSSVTSTELATQKSPRGTGHHWFNLPWPPTRTEIIAMGLVLVLTGGGIGLVALLHKPKPITTVTTVTPVKESAPVPKTVPSTLSGLPVLPEVNQRPVIGVMIENSKDARPQSGLSQAGVVFEAIAEGGITRLLALYQDQQPTNIGPIRSARPYYVQWSEGFKAAYVHVGGSDEALQDIKNWGVQDINQFYNGASFRREASRPSPHNVYSSIPTLTELALKKGYSSVFTGFSRKTASPAKQATASTINLAISSSLYNVQYTYDAVSNTYGRAEGGIDHIDNNTGKRLAPNLVIAMVVPVSAGSKTAQGGSYSDYNTIGSGTAYVFQDGILTTGYWNKTATAAPLTFTDSNGADLKLNPGQTWITAVTAASKVTYK